MKIKEKKMYWLGKQPIDLSQSIYLPKALSKLWIIALKLP